MQVPFLAIASRKGAFALVFNGAATALVWQSWHFWFFDAKAFSGFEASRALRLCRGAAAASKPRVDPGRSEN